MVPEAVKVIVIGGGPVGLVSSIILSLHGIEHVLLERRPSTAIHPKAVGINLRTMEIFRKIGVENEVNRQGAAREISARSAWYTSLGPQGREICSSYAWGGGNWTDAFEKASPCQGANLAQIRLEPILKDRALELNPTGVFFDHEVDQVEEKDDHVIVHFHEGYKHGKPQAQTLKAGYVIGADGGRFLANQLGIKMTGETDLVDMVTAHIKAPLSKYCRSPDIFIYWFVSPELGGSINSGYMYHLGPYPVDPETEEWMFACARLPHERKQPFTEADMLNRLHQTLQIPDLKIELLSLSHWFVNAITAEQYISRNRRIFLVGDTAHRIPPWGAFGVNTGIQDVDNLVWKLALALKAPSTNFDNLLLSYDSERRAIGEMVAKSGLYNMRAHALTIDHVIGISPEKSISDNVLAMEQYFDVNNLVEGKEKRERVHRGLQILEVEFQPLGAIAGWSYDLDYDADYKGKIEMSQKGSNPQINDDGQMELCAYRPSTMPGSQLPHAWLVSNDQDRKSSREFMKLDKFTLFGMSSEWKSVQHWRIEVIIVGEKGTGNWQDAEGTWTQRIGALANGGALLVRPDGIIAYRWWDNTFLNGGCNEEDLKKVVDKALRLRG